MTAGNNRGPHHPPAGLIAKGVLINKADLVRESSHTFVLFVPEHHHTVQDSYRMPPKNQVPRRSSATPRLEGQAPRRNNSSQLITFVDSQDPNSRSAIQRHTAHHSNAQRRDARLRSLRSNRPRLLEWQRRLSADTDAASNTSPRDSTTSTSPSPAPPMRANLSAPGSISTEVTKADPVVTSRVRALSPPAQEADQPTNEPIITDVLIESFLDCLCPFSNRGNFRDVIHYIRRRDICSRKLLLAIMLLTVTSARSDEPTDVKNDKVQLLYGEATRLLHARLTKPETASSDENIQAVLLLIAYASDTGSEGEVQIHTEALSRMIRERGGAAVLASEIDSTLMMQLQTISKSRRFHLTLGCRSACSSKRRFPSDSDLLGLNSR